jgi:hypothetical protein
MELPEFFFFQTEEQEGPLPHGIIPPSFFEKKEQTPSYHR